MHLKTVQSVDIHPQVEVVVKMSDLVGDQDYDGSGLQLTLEDLGKYSLPNH